MRPLSPRAISSDARETFTYTVSFNEQMNQDAFGLDDARDGNSIKLMYSGNYFQQISDQFIHEYLEQPPTGSYVEGAHNAQIPEFNRYSKEMSVQSFLAEDEE